MSTVAPDAEPARSALPSTGRPAEARIGAQRPERLDSAGWTLLFVLAGVAFLEGLDMSMMAVALPSMRADLGMTTGSLQWVVSAYVLGYGGFVLLGGRASDLLGRRRMFLLWLGVFIAFSGLGGLAVEGWMLIVARFVTGVAAAFLTPAGLSILTTTFAEGPARQKAILVYAGVGAAGFSLGMVAGGLLTSIHWRWVFFAPVLIATAFLLVAVRAIPAEQRQDNAVTRRTFDLPGTLTLTLGMLLVVYALVEAPALPAWRTTGALVAGGLALTAFVAIERRSPTPLIRLGILRSAQLVRANLGIGLFVGAFVGFQFVMVLYLQDLRQWTELQTGLAMTVLGLDALVAPTLTPILVRRFGNLRVLFGGVVLSVIAYAILAGLGADWTYAAMLPAFVLIGLAFAFSYGTLTIAATDGIDDDEQGLAGGIFTMSTQFGAALGLAVTTLVLAAHLVVDATARQQLDTFRAALVVPVVTATLGLAIAAVGVFRRHQQV